MNQTLKASFVNEETLMICPESSGSQVAVSQSGHGALFFLYKILMLEHTDWTGSKNVLVWNVLPGNTDKTEQYCFAGCLDVL